MSETEEEDIHRTPTKKRKPAQIPRTQKYRSEWEQDQRFKSWLTSAADKKNAFCKACNSTILPRLASLIQHSTSQKHMKIMRGFSSVSTVAKLLQEPIVDKIKEAEIKLCAVLVEHNIPFQIMDHLSEVIQSTFSTPDIASNFSCKRTKARCVTYNVLAAQMQEDLLKDISSSNETNELPKVKFSLIIDESTDISVKSNLAIVVKYFSEHESIVKSRLLALVEVEDKTAQGLFNTIKQVITKHGLRVSNIIGFAADTTNVMFGENNSVAQKIREESPKCIFVKCVCHSTALAVSKACKLLPRAIEDLVRDTYNYFAYSSKRRSEFKSFQSFTDTPEHNILKLYDIRWLSLRACVVRILEQWNPLQLFFQDQHLPERLLAAERLNDMFQNPYYHLYLLFLSNVLTVTDKFNLMFQAKYSNVHNLYPSMSEAYKIILSMYMKVSYVRSTKANEINPESAVNFQPIENIYLGVKAANFITSNDIIKNDDRSNLLSFLQTCQRFLITLCIELKTRLPFDNELMPMLEFIDPTKIMSRELPTLNQITLRLYDTDFSEVVDQEWRALQLSPKLQSLVEQNASQSSENFWAQLNLEKNFEDVFTYKNLCKLVFTLMCIPVSNVDCERIFSSVSLIKTKHRNKLNTDSVEKIIIIKEALGGDCFNFKPSGKIIKRFDSKIYSDNK